MFSKIVVGAAQIYCTCDFFENLLRVDDDHPHDVVEVIYRDLRVMLTIPHILTQPRWDEHNHPQRQDAIELLEPMASSAHFSSKTQGKPPTSSFGPAIPKWAEKLSSLKQFCNILDFTVQILDLTDSLSK